MRAGLDVAHSRRDTLWAPWRMAYISKAEKMTGCLFCHVRRTRIDKPNLVLARRDNALLMLNRFPYNPGHVMVAVNRHVAKFGDLREEERNALMDLTALAEDVLASEYGPHGMNYGANVGRVAGAGYPGHLHMHLVPRWKGDTNFMPAIAETKVLPESLGRTWSRLRRAVREREKAGRR